MRQILLLILIFLCLQLIFISCYSQDYLKYNSYINQAKDLQTKDDNSNIYYNNAICYYDSAFNIVNNNGFLKDYKIAANFALEANNFDKAKDYSKEILKKGYSFRKLKNNISKTNKEFKNSTQFNELKENYKEQKKEYKFDKNNKIKREIYRIFARDQRHRMFKYNAVKQNKKDSLNVVQLKEICSELGHFPSNKDVKEFSLDLLQPTLLHMNPEDACYFANKLLELYLLGQYSDIRFVFQILDQASYREGTIYGYNSDGFFIKEEMPYFYNEKGVHKQSFGFVKFSENDDNTWKHYIVPIYDIEYSDSVRNIFGFLSTEQSLLLNEALIYDIDLFEDKWGEFKLRK